MGTVKQDANGVPEEWTLLHAGVNRLVKNGKDYELHLSVDELDAIAAYQAKKARRSRSTPTIISTFWRRNTAWRSVKRCA